MTDAQPIMQTVLNCVANYIACRPS